MKWTRTKQNNGTFRYDAEVDGETWSIRGRAARQPVQGSMVFGQWVGHTDTIRTDSYDVYRNERIVFVADRLNDAKRYIGHRVSA